MIPRPRTGHPQVKHGTEHYWRVIRGFDGEFTYRDVLGHADGPTIDTVRLAVTQLVKLGYVAFVREEKLTQAWPTKHFRCIRPDARLPRIVTPGARGLQGKRQLFMWRTMRTLAQWTILELATASSTDEVEVKPQLASGYVWRLVRADIVQVLVPKRGFGRGGGFLPAVYRLRPGANTGPKAPEVYRDRGVLDPNLKVWVHEFASDAAQTEASA